jgi:4-cresol dehydrogenase (hydroxylating)
MLGMTLPVAFAMSLVIAGLAEVAAPRAQVAIAQWGQTTLGLDGGPNARHWFRLGPRILTARAGPDTSLVGNFLERGFGHSALGDRASTACGMEVVLGTGEILRTGFGHYAGARATHTDRHGVGPALDGLFFQSSYGIVVRMGIWLLPKPEAFSGFRATAARREDLGELVEKIGALRRQGLVRSCVHILNPLRALMKTIPYPWEDTEGRRPVSSALRQRWCQELGVGEWNASGAVYGPPEVVTSVMAAIRARITPFPTWQLDETSIARLREEGRTTLADSLASSAALLSGNPSDGILRTAAWRSRGAHPTSLDPIENEAGLMWIVPTLPATGEDAAVVEKVVRETLEGHGFDAPMTFTFINERTLTCTGNISFNRRDPEDTRAAQAAYRAAMTKLIELGYPPYRSGVGGYDLLHDGSSFWSVASDLRKVLDPDGVLSPGHYVPERGREA